MGVEEASIRHKPGITAGPGRQRAGVQAEQAAGRGWQALRIGSEAHRIENSDSCGIRGQERSTPSPAVTPTFMEYHSLLSG